jgi:iron complex outermembrane recepter protein
VTHSSACRRTYIVVYALSILAFFCFAKPQLNAQDQAAARLDGTILDAEGGTVPNATVTATNKATGATKSVRSDGSGVYAFDVMEPGTYTIDASGNGFTASSKTDIVLTAGQKAQVNLTMKVSAVMEEVTVNAGVDSVAVQTAPSGGFLEARSAQSLVSNTYIENFTSPVADYGEIVQIVPGAFTTSSDGIGLGQSKTYFRGFQDGDYDIDFDGIPFYDTNTPTHHSWSFFPVQWIGGVDFDRSPGTASTIGPTPFGGSIHYLSKPLTSERDFRVTGSYGTWNTKLFDGAFNSGNFGLFGSPAKSNLFVDVHHMSSDGYQSFNYNLRSAGALLYQYTFSPKTVLTGFSGVVHLDSNGPNISSTRCMLYGPAATGATSSNDLGCNYSLYVNGSTTATTFNQPYTGAGIKFLLTDNADPSSWFDYQYNKYQVYTDFEYVGLRHEFGKGWYMDFKGYTLNYDNGELYSNATAITDDTVAQAASLPGVVMASTSAGGKAVPYYDGVAVAPCNVQVAKTSKTTGAITSVAEPCGIDKYNSYRKYGETLLVTQTSGLGVFRAGLWYEWAKTNRHQYPSDPASGWADQALPKFNEQFWTNSYQPYLEYEFHVTPQFNITAGGKLAYYTIDVLHHADDGATVGPLTCTLAVPTAPCSATITDTGSFTAWLPSLDFNYRVMPNWSIYAQGSTGSIVPPSAVYDYNQTSASASAAVPQLQTAPKQQRSTTYQVGTVWAGQRATLDADAYHVRFENTYSSTTDNIPGDVDLGDTIFYLQPSSITQGIEFEGNFVLAPGISLYLNSTAANAYYSGDLNANTTSTSQSNPVYERAPRGLWVAQTPSDTEMEGLTYQRSGFDLGLFNKRVGVERLDNGQYHNQGIIPPFSSLGAYVNYTIRNRNIFDQTKIRLSGTNLLDAHNVQNDSFAGAANTIYLYGGGACTAPTAANPCDQFVTNGPTPINGADTPSLMAGRSFSVSVTFGFAPEDGKSH